MITLDFLSYRLDMPIWVVVVLAVLVAVVGGGRFTRVVVYDDFPPTIWLRVQWDKLTEGNEWNKLLHCFWCFSHWVSAVVILWFGVGLVVPWIGYAWWIFWGWFAISYLTAMLIARDEPSDNA